MKGISCPHQFHYVIWFHLLFNSILTYSQKVNLVLPRGNNTKVLYSEYSNSKNLLLTVGENDPVVRVWNTVSGKLLHELIGHGQKVNSAHFSENAQFILTASDDNTICYWSVSGGLISQLRGHEKPVSEAIFSNDNQTIISVSLDRSVKLWSRSTGMLIKDLRNHHYGVKQVKINLSTNEIVTASNYELIIWESNGAYKKLIEITKNSSLESFHFSPDNKKIFVRLYLWGLQCFDSETYKDLYTIRNRWGFDDILFTNYSTFLLHNGMRGLLQERNINTGNVAREIRLTDFGGFGLTSACLDTKNNSLVFTIGAHEIRSVDLNHPSNIRWRKKLNTNKLVRNPHGGSILAIGGFGPPSIIDWQSGSIVQKLSGNTQFVNNIAAISSDLVVSTNASIRFLNIQNGLCSKIIKAGATQTVTNSSENNLFSILGASGVHEFDDFWDIEEEQTLKNCTNKDTAPTPENQTV